MSRGATARLFAALDPSLEVREELVAWARGAAAGWSSRAAGAPGQQARVLDARSLHLTLCFLGSRPVDELDALVPALGSCATPVGELSVGAPLWLPARRPRALAVQIHDRDGSLARLQSRLSDALAEASDWRPERSKTGKRRFRAHITLVRISAGKTRTHRAGEELPMFAPTPQLRFTPESIVLYRSWLEPSGATYQALAACELTADGAGAHSWPSTLDSTGTRLQRSVEPSVEMNGLEPSSQIGSEPSSQE